MSGLEVVGVILGAYPLILSALDAYKATRGGKGALSLIRNLKTEEIIFGEFVHNLVGSNVSEGGLAHITATTSQSHALWDSDTFKADLRTRLGSDKADNVIEILLEIRGLLDSVQQELASSDRGVEVLRRFRARIRQVKYSLPQSSLKQRLDELTAYNVQLQRLLADRSLPSESIPRRRSKPPRRYLRRNPSHVVDLYNAICDGYRCECDVPHFANFSIPRISDELRTDSGLISGWEFELLFATKDSVENENPTASPIELEGLMTNWSQLHSGGETIGTSRRVSVTECSQSRGNPLLDLCILTKTLSPEESSSDRLIGFLKRKEKQYQLQTPKRAPSPCSPKVECLDHLLTDEDFLFSRKERIHLALSLSHAILSFYSTPWIDAYWTWRDFCIDRDNEGQLFATRRFYSNHKDMLTPGTSPASSLWAIHGEPSLTRLGFALIELALGKRLVDLRQYYQHPSTDPDTLDFLTAKNLIDSGRVMRAESQAYEDVVRVCLEHQFIRSSELLHKYNLILEIDTAKSMATSSPSDQDHIDCFDAKNCAITDEVDWVQEIVAASDRDTRKQPWKSTFTAPVGARFDDCQDLVTIRKSTGAQTNPSCPFNTQGSSLAA
ncbi:MAG: hypothetical protein Q9219_004473 [cf. Caloplaca sp. 3 TL-2023]